MVDYRLSVTKLLSFSPQHSSPLSRFISITPATPYFSPLTAIWYAVCLQCCINAFIIKLPGAKKRDDFSRRYFKNKCRPLFLCKTGRIRILNVQYITPMCEAFSGVHLKGQHLQTNSASAFHLKQLIDQSLAPMDRSRMPRLDVPAGQLDRFSVHHLFSNGKHWTQLQKMAATIIYYLQKFRSRLDAHDDIRVRLSSTIWWCDLLVSSKHEQCAHY